MTLKVLQLGQSNAVGLGLGGTLTTSLDYRVRAWNNENTSVARKVGTKFIKPLIGNYPLNANDSYQNSGIWFSSKLAKLSGNSVQFMLVAKGGTPLDAYDNRSSNPFLFNEIVLNWGMSGIGAVDFLIHCGHESNRFDNAMVYSEKQDHIFSTLKSLGVIGPSTIVMITGLAERESDHKYLNDNVLKPYCQLRGYYYVSTTGLEQQPLPDLSHFTGSSYIKLGMDRMFESIPQTCFSRESLAEDIQEYGVTASGEYWAYKNGHKRILWTPILEWTFPHSLFTKWDYPIQFNDTPSISYTLCSMQSKDMTPSKIGGSIFMLDNVNNAWAQIRLQSDNLYTSGNEKIGAMLEAYGA